MIANTQANPLSALLSALNPAATSVMGSGTGPSQTRFDLTLLEMTKHVHDSAETLSTIVPDKVRRALESALGTLANQAPETQMQFGKMPEAIRFQNEVVSRAVASAGLNTAEHKQLDELVTMVVSRVQSSLQPVIALPVEPVEGASRAFSVLHSGPQGGTTVPYETSTVKTSSEIQAPVTVKPVEDSDPAKQLPQLAAALPVPMLISTRTQIEADPKAEAATPISGAQHQPVGSLKSVQQPQAVVLTSQAPKPIQTNEATTMPTDSQPRPQVQVLQGTAPMVQTVNPKISPEISQTSNKTQIVPVSAPAIKQAPEIAVASSGQQQAQAVPQVSTQASRQEPKAAATNDSAPKAAVALQPNMPQFEILSSNVSPPEIVPGSEVRLSDIEAKAPVQVSKGDGPAAVVSEPLQRPATLNVNVAPQPAATPSALKPAAAVPAPQVQIAQVQPAAAPAAVVIPVQVSNASAEPVQAAAPSAEADEAPMAITPMRRFLDEASLRASARENTSAVQAPMMLTQETFKDLAASISKEYSLRENVFQQAIAAIEDASQTASQIRIHLKPETLGSLEVSLSMEGGKLTARLIASSDEVRDVFAANLQQFKQALESQGLIVNQLSVAVRADSNSQGQPQPWQQQQPLWQAAKEEIQQPMNPWPAFNTAEGFTGLSSTFNALA